MGVRRRWRVVQRATAGMLGVGLLGATLVTGPVATADEGLAESSRSRYVLEEGAN
jgi:hypothetical protein